jgi:hypothetical protein
MSLNNKVIKMVGGTLTVIGLLFTGFLAHDAYYARAADVKRIESQVVREMTDLKIELLESRRQAILRDLRTADPAIRPELRETLDATERNIKRHEDRLRTLDAVK